MMEWLRNNTWLVPTMLVMGGVMTALGTWLLFTNAKSKSGVGMLITSAILQTLAGLIWYQQPGRFG